MEQDQLKRIVVIGSSCSGKSTFARQLAELQQSTYIELDALHWLPNWEEREDSEMRVLVEKATAAERWVVDGNYSAVRESTWGRATTLIWLNYSFPVVFGQCISRSIKRIVHKEELWGTDNKETIRRSFFSNESIIWWVLKSYSSVKRRYKRIFKQNTYPKINKIELKSREAAKIFLLNLERK